MESCIYLCLFHTLQQLDPNIELSYVPYYLNHHDNNHRIDRVEMCYYANISDIPNREIMHQQIVQ